MNKRFLLFLCAMILAVSPAFAQFKVAGVVTDQKDGSPIPFASIVVKGTTTGVAADADGKYTITAPKSDATLVFSSIGFATQEIAINGKATVNVTLGPDAEALDEVMVVAYGTATKSSFTGSAGKVSGEKIELVPSANPLNTLNGSTPGIRLTSTGGQPGDDASITIRGVGSLNGNTDPLIVMDGMIYSGSLSSIPSNEIESITVLKDAASTALYGSRAANGVIMITSKQGKGEKPTINVKISHGFTSREQKNYEVMDYKSYLENYWRQIYNNHMLDTKSSLTSEESAKMASKEVLTNIGFVNNKLFPWTGDGVTRENVVGNDGKYNPNATFLWEDDVNWTDAVERVGHVQDYSVSATGKGKYTSYFGSFGYLNNQGYMKGTGFERFSGRANVSFSKKWLKFGVNVSAAMTDKSGNLTESSGGLSNPFHQTQKITPVYPIHVHNADGSILNVDGRDIYDFGEGQYDMPLRTEGGSANIVAYVETRSSHYKRNTINMKPYLEITFLKDFKLAVNGSIYNADYSTQTPAIAYADKLSNATSVSMSFTKTKTFAVNQLLTWNHAFGDHHVDALLGHESNAYYYQYVSADKNNQVIPGTNYEFNNYSQAGSAPEGYANTYNTEGYFARANYDYASKYFFSASFRRDGTSKFHTSSRWGNFWSVGASWIMTNEEWLKSASWLDNLKLRASIGTVGSDNLGAYYPYMALYVLNQNNTEAGYTQSMTSSGNNNLQWEVSTNWDAAVEFSMFNRRLSGSVEYFHRNTTNLLMDVTLAPSAGLSSYPSNDGGLLNSGVEFVLAGDIIRTKAVKWNLGINGSFLNNKITNLPIPAYNINSNYNRIEQGHSVYEWYLYQWAGVNPATGLNYFELGSSFYKEDGSYIDNIDTNPDVVKIDDKYYTTAISKSKETFSGSSLPKVYGGMTTNLSFAGFTLDVNLYYQLGGKSVDLAYASLMNEGLTSKTTVNRHMDLANSWTKPGDVTDVAILTSQPTPVGTSTYTENTCATKSTRWLTSTNMLEINNITLSYDFSKNVCKSLGIHGLKIYAAADHLAILNARRGMYTNYSLSNYKTHGGISKPARTISIGLNFSL